MVYVVANIAFGLCVEVVKLKVSPHFPHPLILKYGIKML
jgi:hypothetical protein